MKEKDRILSLVEQGVISTEEAIALLEKIGQPTQEHPKTESTVTEYEDKDRKRLEKVLEKITGKINRYSVELDTLEQTKQKLEQERQEKEQQLVALEKQDDGSRSFEMKKEFLEAEIDLLEDRIDDIEDRMDDIEDATEELQEELEEQRVTDDNYHKRVQKRLTGRDVADGIDRFVSGLTSALQGGLNYVNNNVEWESRTVKVPKITSEEIALTIDTNETAASVLTIKVANGDVKLKPWQESFVRIEGNYKLYGHFDEELEVALKERITLTDDNDSVQFLIDSKRVIADVTILVPEREYDYVSIHTLNALIRLKDIQGKDFMLKSQNGDVSAKHIQVTMVEAHVTNGHVKLLESSIRDAHVKVVNGHIVIDRPILSSKLSTVNGTVRVSKIDDTVQSVIASSVNGEVDCRLVPTTEFEAQLRTILGTIHHQGIEAEMIHSEKRVANRRVELRRITKGEPVRLELSTNLGKVTLQEEGEE